MGRPASRRAKSFIVPASAPDAGCSHKAAAKTSKPPAKADKPRESTGDPSLPRASPQPAAPTSGKPSWRPNTSYVLWAELLRHCFDEDVLACLLWGWVSRWIRPPGSSILHPTAVGSCLGTRPLVALGCVGRNLSDWHSAADGRKELGFLSCPAPSTPMKRSCSPRECGNHPSIGDSVAHRFVRHSGGAYPALGDSRRIWDQPRNGCSPPIPTQPWPTSL